MNNKYPAPTVSLFRGKLLASCLYSHSSPPQLPMVPYLPQPILIQIQTPMKEYSFLSPKVTKPMDTFQSLS